MTVFILMTLSATGLTVFIENTYVAVTGNQTSVLSQAHHVDVFACAGEKSNSCCDDRGDIAPRLPFLLLSERLID